MNEDTSKINYNFRYTRGTLLKKNTLVYVLTSVRKYGPTMLHANLNYFFFQNVLKAKA